MNNGLWAGVFNPPFLLASALFLYLCQTFSLIQHGSPGDSIATTSYHQDSYDESERQCFFAGIDHLFSKNSIALNKAI